MADIKFGELRQCCDRLHIVEGESVAGGRSVDQKQVDFPVACPEPIGGPLPDRLDQLVRELLGRHVGDPARGIDLERGVVDIPRSAPKDEADVPLA